MSKSLQVCEFKPKAVQGLYYFDHFEHESGNGAFIQRYRGTPVYWVYQDTKGERFEFDHIHELKAHLNKE